MKLGSIIILNDNIVVKLRYIMVLSIQKAIDYPTSDGEPLAETYAHMYVMLVTLEALRQYLLGQQATVLANQFLYYAQGLPKLRVAPDVMVILGVEPGGRDSYKIWEEQQVPSVIFEMTSAATKGRDLDYKKNLYEQMGVREYWLFDPRGEWIEGQLLGYRLMNDEYRKIQNNESLVLNLKLGVEGELIEFYRLDNGEKLLSRQELTEALAQERQEKEELIRRLTDRGIDVNTL